MSVQLQDADPQADRRSRALLSAAMEPGNPRIARLVDELGAQAVVAQLRATRPDRPVRWHTLLAELDPDLVLHRAAERGVRFVAPGDDEWPAALDVLAQAGARDRFGGSCLGLWVRGSANVSELTSGSVAVVGSRGASAYGTHVASELASGLAEAGRTVVSGAAFGIDAASHRGALAVEGPTVAVLASGPDVPYPRSNAVLVERIAAGGLVLSEVPPGSTPTRTRFLVRNRLIAALSVGTVVVEATARSGALNTAGWAEQCGRMVMGVPGPVTSSLSVGVHDLIRDGANLVGDAAAVLELVGVVGQDPDSEHRGPERPWDALPPLLDEVFERLPAASGMTLVSLAKDSGLSARECLSVLGQLSMLGLAESLDGRWRVGEQVRRANADAALQRRRDAEAAHSGGMPG